MEVLEYNWGGIDKGSQQHYVRRNLFRKVAYCRYVNAMVCLVLIGIMSILSNDAQTEGFVFTGKERAYCKLTDVVWRREVYNGACTVAESKTATRDLFTIRISSADPIWFASHRDSGLQYLPHGGGQPTPVRFINREGIRGCSDKAIFGLRLTSSIDRETTHSGARKAFA